MGGQQNQGGMGQGQFGGKGMNGMNQGGMGQKSIW
jgi:hypothetical protein